MSEEPGTDTKACEYWEEDDTKVSMFLRRILVVGGQSSVGTMSDTEVCEERTVNNWS